MQIEHVRLSSAMIVEAPIAFLPSRGSSATQLFAKKFTNKGMSVQFRWVVRVFHRQEPGPP